MVVIPAEHRLTLPQGDLCWFEWGVPSERPSLLLLHATGFHARVWDATIAALPDDLHIVAPDLRGHGRSYNPDSIVDWGATADDLVGLVETAFSGRLVGVGHSMGGYCLAHLAAAMPGWFERLLLVDAVMLPPDTYEPDAPIPDAAEHPVSRRRNAWESPEAMITSFAPRVPYANWLPQVLDDYCRYGLVPDGDGAGYVLGCPPRIEASAYLGSLHNDAAPIIAGVDCPVTVLRARTGERTGSMDFSISPTWPGLAAAFRDGRDMQWPDVSHFIPMEVPERLAALILSEVEAAERD